MRVLFVTGIFPPDAGGPASYVPRMAAALAARGHTVTVLTLSDRLDHDDRAWGFAVHRLRRRPPLRRAAAVVAQIVRHGRHADVVFVHGLALEAVAANVLLRRPFVHKVVGDLAWERAHRQGRFEDTADAFQRAGVPLRLRAARALRGLWTRRADAVVVPSAYLAQLVAGWGVAASRIAVIYNAVSLPAHVAPAAIPLATTRHVLSVSRLVRHKHVERLVDALAALPPEVGLVVVGEGPERAALERRVARLGLSDRVWLAGRRTPEEVAGLMGACDVYALVSSYEGLPHTVLEARALGLVVVATPLPGTREALGGSPRHVCVSGEGATAVAAALREGLDRATATPRQPEHDPRFDVETMVARTEALLARVAPARRRAA